jgi:hypothetical protein
VLITLSWLAVVVVVLTLAAVVAQVGFALELDLASPLVQITQLLLDLAGLEILLLVELEQVEVILFFLLLLLLVEAVVGH